MIAALFVERGGPYFGLRGIECWWEPTTDQILLPIIEPRDARNYPGPHPVVAHPPCDRWGRYWSGGPSAKVKRKLGDDGGCFESALASVNQWGGVLEHPEASHAWRAFGIERPPKSGGWIGSGGGSGWTCCVEQGHYGHRARKATWLYAAGMPRAALPELTWGPSSGERLDEGFHTAAERRAARTAGMAPRKRLGTFENLATPEQFRSILLAIARAALIGGAA
jgi:hypothetical protein